MLKRKNVARKPIRTKEEEEEDKGMRTFGRVEKTMRGANRELFRSTTFLRGFPSKQGFTALGAKHKGENRRELV
jgi:hypothetical protein